MKNDDFQRIMESWAKHEMKGAPHIRPTAEMYRQVRAQRRPGLFGRLWRHPARFGLALAGLIALTLAYVAVFRPAILRDPRSAQEIFLLGQREGLVEDKGATRPGTEKRGPKKGGRGTHFFGSMDFEFQREDALASERFSLNNPPENIPVLTSSDNYRLHLEPAVDIHLYVFQIASTGTLLRLFPDRTFSPEANPLHGGKLLLLPEAPNWFYLGEVKGQERIIVVTSTQPIRNLEQLYERYTEAADDSSREKVLSVLLETLGDQPRAVGDSVVVKILNIKHQ